MTELFYLMLCCLKKEQTFRDDSTPLRSQKALAGWFMYTPTVCDRKHLQQSHEWRPSSHVFKSKALGSTHFTTLLLSPLSFIFLSMFLLCLLGDSETAGIRIVSVYCPPISLVPLQEIWVLCWQVPSLRGFYSADRPVSMHAQFCWLLGTHHTDLLTHTSWKAPLRVCLHVSTVLFAMFDPPVQAGCTHSVCLLHSFLFPHPLSKLPGFLILRLSQLLLSFFTLGQEQMILDGSWMR